MPFAVVKNRWSHLQYHMLAVSSYFYSDHFCSLVDLHTHTHTTHVHDTLLFCVYIIRGSGRRNHTDNLLSSALVWSCEILNYFLTFLVMVELRDRRLLD